MAIDCKIDEMRLNTKLQNKKNFVIFEIQTLEKRLDPPRSLSEMNLSLEQNNKSRSRIK
jgi:hypothetical protein